MSSQLQAWLHQARDEYMYLPMYYLILFVLSAKKGIRERNDDWENMKGLGREAWYMYSFFSFFFALVYWPFVIRTLSTKSTNQTPGKG